MYLKALGPLESAVMDVIWSHGESDVDGVKAHLTVPLAYTTVMTTLSRLFEKGLLHRRKVGKAFLYSESISKAEKLQKDLSADLTFLLHNSKSIREAVIGHLVDAMEHLDEGLLGELERRVQEKRLALAETDSSNPE
jgi:predicted transcriptional regulator